MAELENAVVEEQQLPEEPQEPSKPSKGQRFKAGLKEWWRKKLVTLKIKTQFIPLFILFISTLIYYCSLGNLSQAVLIFPTVKYAGFAMFVNTLLTIIVLVMFLNAFPKRRKPSKSGKPHKFKNINIVALVAVFVIMVAIIACDLVYFLMMTDFIGDGVDKYPIITKAFVDIFIHIAFVGIALVALATLPLYKKALGKINTRKNIESTQLKEEIDTSAEV